MLLGPEGTPAWVGVVLWPSSVTGFLTPAGWFWDVTSVWGSGVGCVGGGGWGGGGVVVC